MTGPRIEPEPVVQAVEQYVSGEHRAADQYDNKTPLDESGIYDLHTLAAQVYAMGWDDGERAAMRKAQAEMSRAEKAKKV